MELNIDGVLWGSDDPVRVKSYENLCADASGNVLLAGLGTGVFPELSLNNQNITSVTVVEISQEVIDLVLQKKPHLNNPKIKIINADFFEYAKQTTDKFDWILGDIWDAINFSPAYINDWFRFISLW